MLDVNYPIEAMDLLLDEQCLLGRYAPLIPHKSALIAGLRRLGCKTKADAARLTDEELVRAGLPDGSLAPLFRRFLELYDPSPQKFREISKVTADPAEQGAFRELYHLPGIKAVRAALYCRAGYRSVRSIAEAAPEDILARTTQVIAEEGLTCIPPLPKEIRTQVAVAKALTWEADPAH